MTQNIKIKNTIILKSKIVAYSFKEENNYISLKIYTENKEFGCEYYNYTPNHSDYQRASSYDSVDWQEAQANIKLLKNLK